MPCTYFETDEERAASKAEREKKQERELDKVTRLLCGIVEQLYSSKATGSIIHVNPELKDWYNNHLEADKQRKKAEHEKLVKSALDKLTAEERKALGLK